MWPDLGWDGLSSERWKWRTMEIMHSLIQWAMETGLDTVKEGVTNGQVLLEGSPCDQTHHPAVLCPEVTWKPLNSLHSCPWATLFGPCVCVCVLSWLFATPWTVSGSSVHGIIPLRILESVAVSFSRGSSWARNQIRDSCISCIGRQILYHWATWEVQLDHEWALIKGNVLSLWSWN